MQLLINLLKSFHCFSLSVISFSLLLSACSHHYADKPLPPDFANTAKGKLVAVVWLSPASLFSTPGFYTSSGKQLKTKAPNIARVRYNYYVFDDRADKEYGQERAYTGKEYIRAFVHTISTDSLIDRWHNTLIPNALKQYGFQVVAVKEEHTETIRGRSSFLSGLSGNVVMEILANDLTYEFKELPEIQYLFVIELMGVGIAAGSGEESSIGYNLETMELSGETAVYGSLLDAKSKRRLWQHLSIVQEPLLDERNHPIFYYPSTNRAKEPHVSGETIKAAIEKSFEKAMAETYLSFFQRALE